MRCNPANPLTLALFVIRPPSWQVLYRSYKRLPNSKKMLNLVSSNSERQPHRLLTARSDFNDKQTFLNAFRKYGIDIDSSRMYVERSGNRTTGSVARRRRKWYWKYLADGKYRRVRLIDDNIQNLEEFLTIKKDLTPALIDKIRTNHFLDASVDPIVFTAYHVDRAGEMKLPGAV